MKSLGLVAAIALLCVGLPSLGLASTARSQDNSATFEDSTGEDSAGPDITTTTVSNNGAGQISFKFAIPNRPSLTSDMLFDMVINSDANTATGDPDSGSEYEIFLFQGEIGLFRWDGTNFSTGVNVPQTSLIFSYAGGVLTIKISASELGNTKKLSFAAAMLSGLTVNGNGDIDDSNSHVDRVPDRGHGFYPYTVKLKALSLVVNKFTRKPATAGKPFTVALVVARSDSGAVLRSGRVTCAATVGGQRLTARTHAVVNKQVTCTWLIPASARGKTIAGSVAVAFEDKSVSRRFSARVG